MRTDPARLVACLGAAVVCTGLAVNAGVLRRLTRTPYETFSSWTAASFAINDGGTFLVTASTEDEGTNPSNEPRLVGWTLPAGLRAEIVPFPVLLGNVTVSDDGQWIAFVSASDPVGQNPDGGVEAFLVSRDGTTIRQLTNRSSFSAPNPRPVLAGSGNRVVFLDTSDPFGTNPAHLEQLFVIDASGLNLRQLTHASDPAKSFCVPSFFGPVPTHAVDDAGRRVVFAHNGDLYGMNAIGLCQIFRIGTDGNLLFQITNGSGDKMWPVLAGDGSRAAYYVASTGTIHSVDYSTAVSTQLAPGYDPSITDNGAWVYFIHDSALFKIPATGGASTPLPSTPPYVFEAEVAGSNTAIAIGAEGDLNGSNPDVTEELWLTDSGGGGAQQLTRIDYLHDFYHYEDPDITPDGTRIAVLGTSEVYRVNADGSGFMQLTPPATAARTGAEHLSLHQDGDTMVFDSWILTPPFSSPQVFALRDDGTDMFQLAPQDAVRPVLGKMSNLAICQQASSVPASVS